MSFGDVVVVHTIGIFNRPFGAYHPINIGDSECMICTALSLHMTFYSLKMETVILSPASTILCTILDFVGRLASCRSPFDCACILFFVAKMTQGPLGAQCFIC